MMGLVGGLSWVRSYSRKQCRRVFWRVRAAVMKAVKNHRRYGSSRCKSTKRQFKFQYDPCSYALNFDDGIHLAADLGDFRIENVRVFPHQQYHPKSPDSFKTTTSTSIPGSATATTWVYVIWLGPFQ